MRHLGPGDRVTRTGDLARLGTVVAGPIAPLATTPPKALDSILVLFDGGETPTELWRRQVILVASAPNSNQPCEFCRDQPLPNAARWVSRQAPAETTCPRCGVTR